VGFIVLFVFLAITAKSTADRIMFTCGLGMFLFFAFIGKVYAALAAREKPGALGTDTVRFQGRTRDCFLIRYSVAPKWFLILMGLVVVPVLGVFCFNSSSSSSPDRFKGIACMCLYPFVMIGSAYSIAKKPGLRLLPEGLLVRASLMSFQPAWQTREIFVPWEAMAQGGIYIRSLKQTLHTEYYTKSQMVGTVFIGIKITDDNLAIAPTAARPVIASMRGQTGYSLLLPATTMEKDQSFAVYSFIGTARVILEIIEFYRKNPDQRSQIGTRQGLMYMESLFGTALRANPQDQTRAPV
jgi:hypothetical protein